MEINVQKTVLKNIGSESFDSDESISSLLDILMKHKVSFDVRITSSLSGLPERYTQSKVLKHHREDKKVDLYASSSNYSMRIKQIPYHNIISINCVLPNDPSFSHVESISDFTTL